MSLLVPVLTSGPLLAGLQLVELLGAGGAVLLRVVAGPGPEVTSIFIFNISSPGDTDKIIVVSIFSLKIHNDL
jgi:hypothetical protein